MMLCTTSRRVPVEFDAIISRFQVYLTNKTGRPIGYAEAIRTFCQVVDMNQKKKNQLIDVLKEKKQKEFSVSFEG